LSFKTRQKHKNFVYLLPLVIPGKSVDKSMVAMQYIKVLTDN